MSLTSQAQLITTVAGNGTTGFSGDGAAATAAELNNPISVAVDIYGNVYIADNGNARIRMVTSTGIISTVAGNGVKSYSGDGGPATAAELKSPVSVFADINGNVLIADQLANRVRIVNSSGIINTFAGNGINAYSGDGGQATNAELDLPTAVAMDATGNVFIADELNERIRRVGTGGVIRTFAGNGSYGFSGDGGQATAAEIALPWGIAVDAAGQMYIADFGNNRIRLVNTSGIISTFAGNGFQGYSGDGGAATAAELYSPTGVSIDTAGNICIADGTNNRTRIVNSSGIINTIAGNGYGAPSSGGYSGDGGNSTAAELYLPWNISADNSGNIYIADETNNRVREVTSVITTGINKQLIASNEVNIYPSPSIGLFTISGVSQGQVIELYNNFGQKLTTTVVNYTCMHLDISNQPEGIYLIRIQNKNGDVIATKKILKTN